MTADYANMSDDFFVNVELQSTLGLPRGREAVLHLCETVQKRFGEMTNLHRRETGEYVLEGDRSSGSYRWLELQSHRLAAGYFNPRDVEDAFELHRWLLESSIYFLGVSPLDVEALDVLFGFNMDYRGNRDAIVSRALFSGSPLDAMTSDLSAQIIECEPNVVVSLDEDCYLQARLSVETRCNDFQVRTGQYDNEPISVYFTVRRYPPPGRIIDLKQAYEEQRDLCEDLVRRTIAPNIIAPIAATIASAQ